MKVLMIPGAYDFGEEQSGIRRVVEAYFKYLPEYGVEFVSKNESYDIIASHAGATGERTNVAHLHGLYFTGDYSAPNWEYSVNKRIVDALHYAELVTVPSNWVAELFARDMRFKPYVVPHGIEIEEWEHNYHHEGYVLWNKNRTADVCSNIPLRELAGLFPSVKFVTTFAPEQSAGNIYEIGLVTHDAMKKHVQKSAVYLSTTKETFGIGILEAMASGIPVLGFAYGGNLDLVKHGVNGYLARPGDIDDLANGLNYCMKFRDILGDNGREIAKTFTWQKACDLVYNVYKLATMPQKASVSVIIPCYNYGDMDRLGRAVRSVISQTYKPDEIVVVDDGSTKGNAKDIVSAFVENDKGVKVTYIYQENSGVAIARNNGIAHTKTKYVCCLDADDAVEPEFLKVCIDALEAKRSLGIAYTSLLTLTPDGKKQISAWPGKFDYGQALKKRNQVPTCCVFRRVMWERLGGYRQRYAPTGAGAEDAEFWLRAGAYGFDAAKVDDRPLFVYSFMSGAVSGNKEYREVDYTELHPWAKDLLHPFASVATPLKISHQVRQYDEPKVSVIIPVGEKHREILIDPLDSLEGQKFRKWEAIVVNDSGKPLDDWIYTAYPYVKFIDTGGKKGAGYARNLGCKHARGDFIVFLDADDMLLPGALSEMIIAFNRDPSIIYSDYYGKSIIDDVAKLDIQLQKNIVQRIEKTKETIILHQAKEYNCELAQRQPVITGRIYDLYLWCNVTCLIPLAWHNEIGGFDESMDSWEDVDYHWRMARHGKCYTRITSPLMVYRFYTGTRREEGLHTHTQLLQYITSKYEKESIMPCGCKNDNKVQVISPTTAHQSIRSSESMSADSNYKKIVYMHDNYGEHSVIGPSTRTNYGYRKRGDIFIVHVNDIAVQPDLFKIISEEPKVSIPLPKEETPPPQPIVVEEEKEVLAKIDNRTLLRSLPGMSYTKVAKLEKLGIRTYEDIVNKGIDGLAEIEGIGRTNASRWYEAAKYALEQNA